MRLESVFARKIYEDLLSSIHGVIIKAQYETPEATKTPLAD